MAEFQNVVTELAGLRKGPRRPPTLVSRLGRYVKKHPSLYPDEKVFLEQTCQRIDAEQDIEAAWSMVNDISKAEPRDVRTETELALLAVTRNVQACTVAYLDIKTQEQASGTLIEINGRVFVATTAHSVPDNPGGRIAIIGTGSSLITDLIPKVLSSGCEHTNDIAYLEIDRQFVDERLGRVPVSVSRLCPAGVGRDNYWLCIAGYPSAMIQSRQVTPTRIEQEFRAQCWCNPQLLMPENWGMVKSSVRPFDEAVDVLVTYDQNAEINVNGLSSAERLNDPYGLSGGGMWQLSPSARKGVWSAETFGLIAIQNSWPGRGRYLRGTQIQHWLKLVSDAHPELRSFLPT